jgi:hypothetical protein
MVHLGCRDYLARQALQLNTDAVVPLWLEPDCIGQYVVGVDDRNFNQSGFPLILFNPNTSQTLLRSVLRYIEVRPLATASSKFPTRQGGVLFLRAPSCVRWDHPEDC